MIRDQYSERQTDRASVGLEGSSVKLYVITRPLFLVPVASLGYRFYLFLLYRGGADLLAVMLLPLLVVSSVRSFIRCPKRSPDCGVVTEKQGL